MWLSVVDPRSVSQLYSGERIVFNRLKAEGFLDGLENKRILEIGPKHGKDSLLLANLNPSELVLIDLPEKSSKVREWLLQVSNKCKTVFLAGNILYLTQEQYNQLGKFDLIWCLGVLYHNVEQLRLLKRLYDLSNMNGSVVIESETVRNKKLEKQNVVEIHWPQTFKNLQTITHLPSRLAIKSWLEMVGFSYIKIWEDIYSKRLGRQRAVLTARKTKEAKPHISYSESGLNPPYVVGDSN